MKKLLDMLGYCRPEGTATQREFNELYIEPLMGAPDRHGNYVRIIGDHPNVAFMAHHDTVHRLEGYQDVEVSELGYATCPKTSSCLGADCTTGVWLILEMIEAGIPGVYCVFAGEELGCLGSAALVQDNPDWLKQVDAAISLDRWGTTSIITHQSARRTASDAFAHSLSKALDMPGLEPDSGGSYTDSNEFADVISECSNLSVGYYNQHTSREYQDLEYVQVLRDKLLKADWSKLVFERDPNLWEYDDDYGYWGHRMTEYYRTWANKDAKDDDDEEGYLDPLVELVSEHPEEIAKMLRNYSFTYNDVVDEVYFYSNSDELAARYA